MSLESSVTIFIVIMCIGFTLALYVLIKDRIDIIRSIKPNSIGDFFGYKKGMGILGFILVLFIPIGINPILITALNLFGLLIWVPFWILDKLFKLNIFKENNSK